MKIKIFIAAGIVSFVMIHPPILCAQGSLTPPGGPAPTMKSLDQIEPRTLVSFVPYNIVHPGSFYLTTNLTGVGGTNGITIAANNVTLDLNGFALNGVSGSIDGIYVSGSHTNIVVRNGTLSGWGTNGVDGGLANNLSCERLTVSSCSYGIVAYNATVSGCAVQSCGSDGIYIVSSTVSGCTIQSCGNDGISADLAKVSDCKVQSCFTGINASYSTVSGCTVLSSGGDGLSVSYSTVSGCMAQSSGSDGIYANSSTVSGCYVKGSAFSGILVDAPGCQIIGNNCTGNNTTANANNAGIYLDDANNRVEDNQVTASGYAGISVYGTYSGNIIIKNTVAGSGANNYLTPGSQVVGPLITSYGTITSVNPWANFSF